MKLPDMTLNYSYKPFSSYLCHALVREKPQRKRWNRPPKGEGPPPLPSWMTIPQTQDQFLQGLQTATDKLEEQSTGNDLESFREQMLNLTLDGELIAKIMSF